MPGIVTGSICVGLVLGWISVMLLAPSARRPWPRAMSSGLLAATATAIGLALLDLVGAPTIAWPAVLAAGLAGAITHLALRQVLKSIRNR